MKTPFDITLPFNGEPYDKNLFVQIGDELRSTPYFTYIAASQAKEAFKNLIKKLDVFNQFFKQSIAEDVDPDAFEKAKKEWKSKNADRIALAEAAKDQWRAENSHLYRMQPSLPSSSQYDNLFDFAIEGLSLDEAIQGYKSANEALKIVDGPDLDPYCIELKPMLNSEHKPVYDAAMEEINKKYEILTDREIKATLPLVNVVKTRLSLSREKSQNVKPAETFMKKVEAILNLS